MPEFYLIPKRLARKSPRLTSMVKSVEAVSFRAIFWLMRRLSVENALRLSGFTFGLIGPLTDKANKARENLAIAFPTESDEWRRKTTRKIFNHLGRSAAELIKLDQIWAERDKRVELVFEPGAREHMASKRPTVYLTAHVGAWQIATLVTREFAIDISAIYAPESNPIMSEVMMGLRQSLGDHLIPTDAGPRPLIQTLKDGGSIVMAMDTRPDTGKLIPFFGRDALTSTSPAGLALRTNSTLVVARAERLPGAKYRITVYTPLTSPIPDAPVKEQSVALTAMVHEYFEAWIREYPEQWVCLKRRWPKAHKL